MAAGSEGAGAGTPSCAQWATGGQEPGRLPDNPQGAHRAGLGCCKHKLQACQPGAVSCCLAPDQGLGLVGAIKEPALLTEALETAPPLQRTSSFR